MEMSLKALTDQAYWTYAQYFYVEHVISLPTPVYATKCTLIGHFAVLSVYSLIVPWKLAKKVNLYTPSTLTEKTWRKCKEHMPSFLQMLKQQSQKEKQWEESKAHVGLLVFNTKT